MITFRLVLLLLAFVLFALAAAGIASRLNLVAKGLAVWVLALIIA